MSNMNKLVIIGTIALALLILLLVFLSYPIPNSGAEGEPVMVLRSYTIAPELGTELSTILNGVFRRGEGMPPVGRSNIGPGGQLIVAAPEDMQKGIEKMLDDIVKKPPELPPMIDITYWVVAGSPAEETTMPLRVGELKPALVSIASADGPTSFDLLEKSRFPSLSGERAHAETRLFGIEQTATSREGSVFANLHLRNRDLGGGSIRTSVNLKSDQLLVLGQSALPKRLHDQLSSDATLYIVVRAQVDAVTSN